MSQMESEMKDNKNNNNNDGLLKIKYEICLFYSIKYTSLIEEKFGFYLFFFKFW